MLPAEIIHGECRRAMADMEPNSVDAVVCDPPYELAFMGKKWDASGVAYDFMTWRQVLRVLKPGGYLLAFGGTRTYHRMACAIEDADFEIRDCLQWLYGCLPERAEILTDDGWVKGSDVAEGQTVAQWDPQSEAIELGPVQEKIEAPFRGHLVVLHNEDVRQELTPNHRVFRKHWRRKQVNFDRRGQFDREWTAIEAGEINRWQRVKVPLSGYHDGDGIGGEDYAALLGWVWTEGSFDNSGTGVRIYQSSTNQQHVDLIGSLLERLGIEAKHYQRERTYRGRAYTEHTWFWSGEWAKRVRSDLPGKSPSWGLLWRMSQDEKIALYESAMSGDGSRDAFYQKSAADREWFIALLHTVGMRGRDNARKFCVAIRRSDTTEFQRKHLASEKSVSYEGPVWCVRVATGAFIARLDGRVFVTGNSGFPKSHDISKAIDKAAGAERGPGVEGRYTSRRPQHETKAVSAYHDGVGDYGSSLVTAPATDDAKRWDGWGTALKPANEPIVLARKPLEGNVAENVQVWGTGALNVDGCRVGDAGGTKGTGHPGTGLLGIGGNATIEDIGKGRWPANVVLDEAAAAALDAQSGERPGMSGGGKHAEGYEGGMFGAIDCEHTARGDTGGASRFFYVAKASRAEREFGLDVVDDGGVGALRDGGVGALRDGGRHNTAPRRNIHATVKPIALMRWLVRLVTPPGGHVLDPFAGSGTTGIACLLEGFRFTGIELDEDHARIAKARIAAFRRRMVR